ncbi:MAG: serine/threonine-protein kinase [Chitinophagales bacterium]
MKINIKHHNSATKVFLEPRPQASIMITVSKNYEFDPEKDLIGQGGFGKVYRARDTNLGMEVAIKKYAGNLPAKYSLFGEIKRAIHLNHPNLVRYYDAFELEDSSAFGDKIQIGVLEFINGGDFTSLLRTRPGFDVLRKAFIGIMEGLKYLHAKGIIHRDLKPENILIQKEGGEIIPKIADFGISKVIEDGGSGASSMIIGSIEYMAPEQFNVVRYGKENQLHTNLDLWSLGTIIYEAFTGSAPFGKTKQGVSRDEIMRNILEKNLTEIQKVPEPFRQVVRACLIRDASKRAQTVDQLFDLMYSYEHGSTRRIDKTQPNYEGNIETIKGGGTSILEKNTPKPPISITDDSSDGANTPQNIASTASKTTDSTEFSFAMIVPFVTAFLAYAFFESKKTLFGWDTPVSSYIIYPALVCAAMGLVNIFTIFFRDIRRAEIPAYLFSFLVLVYFLTRSLLTHHYTNSGIQGLSFDFTSHPFALYYPYLGIGIVLVSLLASLSRIRWFELIAHYGSIAFLLYILIDVSIEASTAWNIIRILGVVAIAIGIFLWNKQKHDLKGV